MRYNRFLRSGDIDRRLDEIRNAREKIRNNQNPSHLSLAKATDLLIDSCQNYRFLLQSVEDLIELARKGTEAKEFLDSLIKMAVFIKKNFLAINQELTNEYNELTQESESLEEVLDLLDPAD